MLSKSDTCRSSQCSPGLHKTSTKTWSEYECQSIPCIFHISQKEARATAACGAQPQSSQILPSGGYVRVLRILTHLKQSLVLAFSLCIVLSKTRRSDAGSSSWRNQPRHWSLKEKHSCQVILRYLEFFQHLSLHLPPPPKRFC